MWGDDYFTKIVSVIGVYVKMDNATATKERIDVARILIQVPTPQLVSFCEKIESNGKICYVRVMEETQKYTDPCGCWRWSLHGTKEESICSEVGLDIISSSSKYDGEEIQHGGDKTEEGEKGP